MFRSHWHNWSIYLVKLSLFLCTSFLYMNQPFHINSITDWIECRWLQHAADNHPGDPGTRPPGFIFISSISLSTLISVRYCIGIKSCQSCSADMKTHFQLKGISLKFNFCHCAWNNQFDSQLCDSLWDEAGLRILYVCVCLNVSLSFHVLF